MRTIVRNSPDVKSHIEKLWDARNRYVADQIRRYPVPTVLAAVAAAHGLTVEDLRGTSRAEPVALARHHAAWELRCRRLDLSFQQIAAELNRIHHATALHSYKRFIDLLAHGACTAERAAAARMLGDDE